MPYAQPRTLWRSLRVRLLFWNTMVVLLMVFPTLFAVWTAMQHTLYQEFDRVLIEDMGEIELALRQFYTEVPRIKLFLNRKKDVHAQRGWFARLRDNNNSLMMATNNVPTIEFTASETPTTIVIEGIPFRIRQSLVRMPNNKTEFQIQVGASEVGVHEDINLLTRMMILAGTLMLVVAPLGCYWLAGMATAPIAEIIRATSELRPSQLNERLPLRHTGDELDQLSQTINGLLDRLAIFVNEKKDLLANAAHELRSPLAAIRSSVEVALNNQRSSQEYVALLEEIMEECSDLGVLVNQLLLLSESEKGDANSGNTLIALEPVVRRSLNMFQGVAEAAGVELVANRLDTALIRGDEHHLQQVINNLIDNAIKFTPPPGKVEVEVITHPDTREVLLQVSDTGIGIALEDQTRIFERFYRADQARQRTGNQRGNGLGLAICQSIVHILGGSIQLESKPGEGSTFRVLLPLANVPPGSTISNRLD